MLHAPCLTCGQAGGHAWSEEDSLYSWQYWRMTSNMRAQDRVAYAGDACTFLPPFSYVQQFGHSKMDVAVYAYHSDACTQPLFMLPADDHIAITSQARTSQARP